MKNDIGLTNRIAALDKRERDLQVRLQNWGIPYMNMINDRKKEREYLSSIANNADATDTYYEWVSVTEEIHYLEGLQND